MAKEPTKRVALFLTVKASDLLARLSPSERKHGAYVSELIEKAAIEAGLIEGAPEGNGEVAELRQRMAAMQADLDALARRRTSGPEGVG